MIHIECHCHGRLRELLPQAHRGCRRLALKQRLTLYELLAMLRIPHPEVDLALCNGRSVGLQQRIGDRDRLHLYSSTSGLVESGPLQRLRTRPLRLPRFILDVHLARLARRLRLLGLDCWYQPGSADEEIIRLALAQRRTILTRDRGLLHQPAVQHGYYVRATEPTRQLQEVLSRFELYPQLAPFSRCTLCNGLIEAVDKERVRSQVKPQVYRLFEEFFRCGDCGQVYWQGSHYERMLRDLRPWLAPQFSA